MKKRFIGLNGRPIKGEDPLVLLDSGTIIDLEENLRKTGLPQDSAGLLLYANPNTYVIVPGVLNELKSHSSMRINGKVRELEPSTIDVCDTLAQRTQEMIECLKSNTSIDWDTIGYDVWLASQVAFEEGHKKREQDIISSVDREIITTAFYMAQAKPEIDERGRVTITSPDTHIRNTTNLLNKQERYIYKVEYHSPRGRKFKQ